MKSFHKYINHFFYTAGKRFFSFSILITIFSATQAQTIKVFDNTTLQPLQKATIQFDKIQTQITDENGESDISGFTKTKEVIISCIGYQEVLLTWNDLQQMKFMVGLNPTSYNIDEIVVSSSRFEEKRTDVPNQIAIITCKQIENINPSNTGTLLEQSGQVFLQRSQLGGGSPSMRGFEANKVLIVVDGVRMNNAIFRGGHLQNIISLDPSSLDRMELIFGPGSVIYGSDALGGVMHLYTRKPIINADKKFKIMVKSWARYTTADEGYAGHFDLNLSKGKFASLTSVSYSVFGDLRQGNIRNPLDTDWGKRNFYQKWTGVSDTIIKNVDPNIQVGTGYSQYDVLQKILFQQNNKVSHLVNFQYSTSSDIPRYDRLTEISGNGNFSNGDWYYGPQKRLLGSYTLRLNSEKCIYDNANIILAFQQVEESRHQRKFNSAKLSNRKEKANVISLNADFEKKISVNELRYGIEAVMNKVASTADFVNLITDETGATDTRYPDGGASTQSLAAYLTHNWELSKKFIFIQGLRFTNNFLTAKFIDTAFFKFPFTEINQSSNALTGNLGLVFKPGNDWHLALLFSNGFRTPNVDDMTKIFESTGGSLIVPNEKLKPEQVYNAEITIGKRINHSIHIEATGWYAMYNNALTTEPFLFNGEDSIIYNGVLSEVKSTVNKGEAFIYGATSGLHADVTKNFIVYSTLTYTYGRIKTDTIDYPLDHIAPVFGKTGMQLNLKKFSGDAYAMYNGAKTSKNYNLQGEDNQLYSLNPNTGFMPGWITLNAKAGYQFNKFLQLQIAVENILDQNYRTFSSGISSSGRNLMATLRARF